MKTKVQSQLDKILRASVRNIYLVGGLVFAVWIAFFDDASLWQQHKLRDQLDVRRSERAYYKHEIQRLNQRLTELKSDPAALEKFARETYLFKKQGEDVFIIEETPAN